MTLDEALDTYQVAGPMHDDPECPDNWFAVADDEGHIAYFGSERHALAFRLMLVNFRLNAKEQTD